MIGRFVFLHWLCAIGLSHSLLPSGSSGLVLDLSVFRSRGSQPLADGIRFDKGVVQGIPYISFFTRNGEGFAELLDGSATIWKGVGDGKCTAINVYAKGGVNLLSLYLRSSNGSELLCFEQNGGKWKRMDEDDFDDALDSMMNVPSCFAKEPNATFWDLNDALLSERHTAKKGYLAELASIFDGAHNDLYDDHNVHPVEHHYTHSAHNDHYDEDDDYDFDEDDEEEYLSLLSWIIEKLIPGKRHSTLNLESDSNAMVISKPMGLAMYREFLPEDNSIKRVVCGSRELWKAGYNETFQNACLFLTPRKAFCKINAKKKGVTRSHCLEFKNDNWNAIEYKAYSDGLARIITGGIDVDMEHVPEDLGNTLEYASDGYTTVAFFPSQQYKITGVRFSYTNIWLPIEDEVCTSATLYTDGRTYLATVMVDDGKKKGHHFILSAGKGSTRDMQWTRITFDDLVKRLKEFEARAGPEGNPLEVEMNVDNIDDSVARTREYSIADVVVTKKEPLPGNKVVRVVDSKGPIWEAHENQRCLSCEIHSGRGTRILILLLKIEDSLELVYHEQIGTTWGVLREDAEKRIRTLYNH